MEAKRCEHCGEPFAPQRRTAKYCSKDCRTRHAKGEGAPAARRDEAGRRPAPARPTTRIEAEARAELRRAGRLATHAGQTALLLAHRLDHSAGEPGAALAAMSREFAAAMERALKDAKQVSDVARIQAAGADEVGAARDRKAKRVRRGRAGPAGVPAGE